ncbi:hypothetical protein VTL71DRAFT_4972 [Oculimacula yallundae]|uniref:WSC domain-containing protein n=1 Tax=Oculimacula yallundae TaxID=86028 RepID=A0ABR4C5V9_9HELO
MKPSGAIIWLAAFVAAAFGSALLDADDAAHTTKTPRTHHLFASSHTIAQRRDTAKPALSHLYASSHTLAQRQVSASPASSTSIYGLTTVVNGRRAVLSTSITETITTANPLATGTPPINARNMLQALGITTVTSFLGPTSVAISKPTNDTSTILPVLTLTSTVEDVVTVTSDLPLVTANIPAPQSQIQGPTTSEPSISFGPIASTNSNITPVTTAKPQIVPSAGSYTYLGCFREGLEARILSEAFFPNDVNTIEKCADACYPFNYAGAEFGRECWCGNDIKDAFNIDEANCNMPCSGDSQQACGGIVALNVYIRKDMGSSPLSPVPGNPTATGSIETSIVSSTSASSADSTGLATSSALFQTISSLSANTTRLDSSTESSTEVLTSTPASTTSQTSPSSQSSSNLSIILTTSSATTTRNSSTSSRPTKVSSLLLPAPSDLAPTTKVTLTHWITLQAAPSNRRIVTIHEVVTSMITITRQHSYTAPSAYSIIDLNTSVHLNSSSTASDGFEAVTSALSANTSAISAIPQSTHSSPQPHYASSPSTTSSQPPFSATSSLSIAKPAEPAYGTSTHRDNSTVTIISLRTQTALVVSTESSAAHGAGSQTAGNWLGYAVSLIEGDSQAIIYLNNNATKRTKLPKQRTPPKTSFNRSRTNAALLQCTESTKELQLLQFQFPSFRAFY